MFTPCVTRQLLGVGKPRDTALGLGKCNQRCGQLEMAWGLPGLRRGWSCGVPRLWGSQAVGHPGAIRSHGRAEDGLWAQGLDQA